MDILTELKYLEIINQDFKKTTKKQAFEIAKRSLIREKIKDPILPEIVLFGLIFVNFFPPIPFPII